VALTIPFTYKLGGWFRPSSYVGEPRMYGYMGGSIHTAWWSWFSGSTLYAHFHPGVDLWAPHGTPIRAAAYSRVTKAGWSSNSSGYAVNLKILGQNTLVVYGHLSRVACRVGQVVAPGQIIGYVGSSGDASGPHVHFGVQLGSRLFDPLLFFPGGALQNDDRIRPYVTVKAASNIRATPSGTGALVVKLAANTRLAYQGTVVGGSYNWLNPATGKWVVRSDWARVTYNGVMRYVVAVNVIL